MESGRHLYQRHRYQGIFLTTPIEMAVYIASIANNGEITTPRLVKTDGLEAELPSGSSASKPEQIGIPEEYFKIVKEGMRMAVTEGNGARIELSRPENRRQNRHSRSGGQKNFSHSWIVGFYPYENPKYAFVAVLEKGPAGNTIGAPFAMKRFFDWLKLYHPEYTK